jgi:hypothetical protein
VFEESVREYWLGTTTICFGSTCSASLRAWAAQVHPTTPALGPPVSLAHGICTNKRNWSSRKVYWFHKKQICLYFTDNIVPFHKKMIVFLHTNTHKTNFIKCSSFTRSVSSYFPTNGALISKEIRFVSNHDNTYSLFVDHMIYHSTRHHSVHHYQQSHAIFYLGSLT